MPSRAARSERAVGRHDLDRMGQVGQGQPIEEATFVETGVGQEVAGGRAARGQGAGQVLTGEKAGHADVAAEEVVAHLLHRDVVPGVPGHERPEDAGSVGAGQHGDRTAVAAALEHRDHGQAGGSIPLGRRRVHRGEEAVAHPTGAAGGRAGEGVDEGPGHADAVLVLGELVVRTGHRKRAPGQQVVLVRRVGQATAEDPRIDLLPLGHGVDDVRRLSRRVGAHLGLIGELADAERDDTDRGQLGVLVEDAGQRVLERGPVVDARADHDLAVHLDAAVEQHAQPAQAGGALGVAQHVGPQLGVGAVDRDEEGAEALGEDALGIELGETGERGEVAVEEREPVVVVLEVEAAAHALGQLVDEAEGAVVVAGADAVEDGRGHLDPERLAGLLVDADQSGKGCAGALDHHAEVVGVAELLKIDDVARLLPVEGEELITHDQSGPGCRRRLGDRSHRGSGHGGQITPDNLHLMPGVDRVMLAEPRGFCAGVEKAIKALAWMVRVFEPPVYCYHEIVHNRHVVDRFRAQGVIFVDDVGEVPPGAPLMLSAHGSAPEVVDAARAQGGVVVDAVCPLVTKVHHELKVRSRKGYTVLYVGHAGHEEAVGTMAVAPESVRLVEHEEDLEKLDVEGFGGEDRPVALLAQTTLSHDEWRGLMESARRRFPDLWMPNRSDLCFATTNRQAALKSIASEADAVVVIGSANSSNTVALQKVALASGCPRVLRINEADELPDDLAGTVGVTAGASAPEALVEEVIARLAPRDGVTEVTVTTEDEYFPPPPELRELLRALGGTLAFLAGRPGSDRTDPAGQDRAVSAADVLDLLAS